MRLLTAGSLVRVQLGEPKKSVGTTLTDFFILYFICFAKQICLVFSFSRVFSYVFLLTVYQKLMQIFLIDVSESSGKYYQTINYSLSYHSTKEQDDLAKEKANRIIEYLELDSKSDYQKILEIYNFIAQNVEYDLDRKDDNSTEIEHSAYAALCERKAVCQGYALSLYRLMLLAGIDCRIVTGKLNGEDHAWNIVRLNGKYYYLDATMDRMADFYRLFLVSTNEVKDYELSPEFLTDKFKNQYDIATERYENGTERIT